MRLFMLVVKLDGVLDGDDVGLIALFIDDVDHRGEGGGFAGTGGAGDQDQAARLVQQFADRGRQADLVQGQQLGGNLAQDQAEIALFLEHADAETRHFAEGKTEVRAAAFAHMLDVVFGGDAAHQFFGVFRRQRRAFHAVQNAMHADDRRHADADVQIGGTFRDHQLQQIGHRIRHSDFNYNFCMLVKD